MDGDLQVRKILRPLDYVGLSVPVQGRIPNRPIAKADCRPHFVRKYFLPSAHPFADIKRLSVEGVLPWRQRRTSMEQMMKRTLIKYKTKPDMANKNAELIAAVFAELKSTRPEGVRYLSLRLEDDSFIHFVETAADDGTNVIPSLSAFKAFQSGIRERCAEPPLAQGVTIVGNYRMLNEP
jgi:hypothetical protein